MLCNTFLHLPKVGPKTESRIWETGLHHWQDALDAEVHELPRCLQSDEACEALGQGVERYQAGKWRYFDDCLPGGAKWRAYGPLRDRTLYVDIETDGMSNQITVLGVWDGHAFHAFVADENLEDGLQLLESAAVIVTYNGAGFDMPIIRSRFPYNLFNHIHIDLMWPLRRLGFKGGLKGIERQLGLVRSDATQHMSGWDAVYLWQQYCRGSQEAKELLLAYNEEDVRNLQPLMEWTYSTLAAQVGFSLREMA